MRKVTRFKYVKLCSGHNLNIFVYIVKCFLCVSVCVQCVKGGPTTSPERTNDLSHHQHLELISKKLNDPG